MPPLTPLCTFVLLALGSLCAVTSAESRLFRFGLDPTTEIENDNENLELRRAPRRWEVRTERPREQYEAEPEPPAPAPLSAPFEFRPVQVNVKLDRRDGGSVPLVVVPIPVPVPQPANTVCDAREGFNVQRGPVRVSARPPPWVAPVSGSYDEDYAGPVSTPGRRPQSPQSPQYRPREPPRELPYDEPLEQPDQPLQPYEPEDVHEPVPQFEPIASSKTLLQEFLAQTPKSPDQPPMQLSEYDASERAPVSDGNVLVKVKVEAGSAESGSKPKNVQVQVQAPTGRGGRDPPTPRYENLPMMRARLKVISADYTEPYSVWFDQSSGAARVDYHGGTTSTFRTMTPEGRVKRVEVRINRSAGGTSRLCAVSVGAQATADDRAHPALPDITQFAFGGYEESPEGRVEVWRRTVAGRAGEQGAARGEALTTRHELRLLRAAGDRALPLRYTVAVDSSVLGPNTDGYEHTYQPVEAQAFDSKFFEVNMSKECDTTEQLNTASSVDLARLEPLREFLLPHRDPRYDNLFTKFKEQFTRKYVDNTEEAVRKNVMVQSTRFVQAGNRQGATAQLGVNFLGDRLQVEVGRLLGAEVEAERVPGEAFPYSRDDVRAMEQRLPSGFDWRQRGGVTPVRYQGECASCWAFAVVGAVEGALFRVSRRLVELSEQSLVDCAGPFGGKGCGGTWPSHAYNYVEARGLPARDEYPTYKAQVGKCVDESVASQTRISSHVNVTSLSVPALKVAIRKHAPSVVLVDANCKSFLTYKSGVLYDDRCGKTLKKLKHAVLAVGWGNENGEPYFILKNSWSAKWGHKGYIRVQARSNTCGVLTKPSYPHLEQPDVAQPLRSPRRPRAFL